VTGPADATLPRIGLATGGGSGLAGRIGPALLGAGYPLSVHASARADVAGLLAAGAAWSAAPAALAQGCDLLLTALASPAEADALLAGFDGLARASLQHLLVVDLGALAPREMQAVAARLSAFGIDLLDVAQVDGAAGGSAGIGLRAGGSVDAFERARPLLSLVDADVRHVGAVGAGRVVAGCHRIVEALTLEAVAEALTLARRLGADAARVRAALAGGFAASHVLDVHGSRMLSRDFSPGLMAGTHADALGVVVDEAHALGLDLPGSALVAQQLNALVGAGEGALDSSALVKVLERMAGETR
jgi:3-hydroxyisobutyrate dehydrogenase-like beta-hydroxyacid dehydrogenase